MLGTGPRVGALFREGLAVTHPTLTVAAAGKIDRLRERFLDPILAAWPRPHPPMARAVDFDDILSERVGKSPGRDRVQGPCVIVFEGGDGAGISLLQLVDQLRQAYIPAVLLFDTVTDDRLSLEGDGIIVDRHDASPGALARTLHALAERDEAVRQLRLELHAASMVHGGIRGEMDRLHDEMNLAATVQREMIPRTLPQPEGVHVGVLFRPCSYVSGDIYDAVMLDDETLAFLVADAVGHGVPAALLTMVISKSLRKTETVAGETRIIEPAEALERLNHEMCARQGTTPRFATAVYGTIHRRTRKITIAGAGHPPPLIVSPGGREPETVESEGPLLGVFDGASFEQTEFVLKPGETMLMYSDGFETAFPKPGSEGRDIRLPTETYIKHLTDLAGAGCESPEALAEAMLGLGVLLDEQIGSLHQPDDVTAMAISATALSGAGRKSSKRAA
ncbi:MAG: serine/threonine-protein phosphatase [Phycisphaerales bacterium]|nr:MAG: serine/threonine-protein phosphatase [Phycisphaerales bacterium]